MLCHRPSDRAGKVTAQPRRPCPYVNGADSPAAQSFDFSDGILNLNVDALRMPQQAAAEIGKHDAAGVALEQRDCELLL
jgi:hypothetical protein